jgi:hypothetical protein
MNSNFPQCIYCDHVKNGYPSPGDIGPDGKCVMTSYKACNGSENEIKKNSESQVHKYLFMIFVIFTALNLSYYYPLAIPPAILLLFLLS